MKLNLGCGKRLLPKEDGWVNVDQFPLGGVDKVFDLFRFPWPLESECAEEIFASHIIEHIPHLVYEQEPLPRRVQNLGGESVLIYPADCKLVPSTYDGFFRFFQECWRVLKPEGTVHCIAPYWTWAGAVWDPTHTRSIHEATFSYLDPTVANSNFDYQLPFRFCLLWIQFGVLDEWTEKAKTEGLDFDWTLRHYVNVATEIQAKLKKEPWP